MYIYLIIKIDNNINSKYNIYNMLSRVDERTGFITPQQPVIYKVLIPAKQSALSDDLNKVNQKKDFAKNAKFFSYMKHFVKI